MRKLIQKYSQVFKVNSKSVEMTDTDIDVLRLEMLQLDHDFQAKNAVHKKRLEELSECSKKENAETEALEREITAMFVKSSNSAQHLIDKSNDYQAKLTSVLKLTHEYTDVLQKQQLDLQAYESYRHILHEKIQKLSEHHNPVT